MREGVVALKLDEILRSCKEQVAKLGQIQHILSAPHAEQMNLAAKAGSAGAPPSIHSPTGPKLAPSGKIRWLSVRDNQKFLIDVLTLILVFIYAGLTWWQADSAAKQLIEARKATDATVKNFKVGQRAWVMVETLNVQHEFSARTSTGVEFVVKNVGQTPALHFWSVIHAKLEGSACQPTAVARSPIVSYNDIGPGQIETYPDFGLSPLSQGCVDALNSGEATYSIRGELYYKDIFGDDHTTNICSQYEGVASRRMVFCSEGNGIN